VAPRLLLAFGVALALWLWRGALAQAGSSGPRVGLLPPLWQLAVLLAAAVLLALRLPRVRLLPLLPVLLLVLPWLPGAPAALQIWTGPIATAILAGAALGLFVAGRPAVPARLQALLTSPAHAPWTAGAAAFVFFAIVAWGAAPMAPGGDEPHYLVITQSLLYDRDLRIENNHERRDYAAYFAGTLRPDYLVRGRDGAIYSIHAPGLPALVAPAFALGGYPAVVLFLLLLSSITAAVVWWTAFLLTRAPGAAWFGAAAAVTATPAAFHSFTVFPDGPAALCVLVGLWLLVRLGEARHGGAPVARGTLARVGAALALLPWLHTRFALFAGVLGLATLLRLPASREGLRSAAAFLALPVVSALAWFGHFYLLYGTPDPNAPYGTFMRTQSHPSFVTGGLAGLFFDQQFGLLPYAPVHAAAVWGLTALWRRGLPAARGGRRLVVELLLTAGPYLAAVTTLRMWWAGWSAPARFFVPLLPAAAVLCAVAWHRARAPVARVALFAAAGVTAYTTLALALVERGRLAYNVRDGSSLWLEHLSPLADLPHALPSFFRWVDREWLFDAQIAIWIAAVCGALAALHWCERRGVVAGRAALAASIGPALALGATIAASALWAIERVMGTRPTASQVALLEAAADRRLPTAVVYDPFRLVGPQTLFAALRLETPPKLAAGADAPLLAVPGWLPAGRYRLQLEGGLAASATDAAALEVRVLRPAAPLDPRLLRSAPAPPGSRAFTLDLPVDVPALIVRGRGGDGAGRAWLQPTALAGKRTPRAVQARAYGGVQVWFLDGHAFLEPDAFWVRGGAAAEMVLQPVAGGTCLLVLENGAAPNPVEISSGRWHERHDLGAWGRVEVVVPVDAARAAAPVRIASPAGFRPSAVDPRSDDARWLGVRVTPRLRT
jgi:hypothetical protein